MLFVPTAMVIFSELNLQTFNVPVGQFKDDRRNTWVRKVNKLKVKNKDTKTTSVKSFW